MVSNPSGVPWGCTCGEGLNIFALVIYLPDPLGKFLDNLRRELVIGCNPHAHVSVLPPRTLAVPGEVLREEVRARAEEFAPFEIEAGEIRIFQLTDVIYIDLARGADRLQDMHGMLNTGKLAYREPFNYHPHITVAQDLQSADVPALYDLAQQRWREYTGPRSFLAERAVFVQNTAANCWIDLAEITFGAVPTAP